MSQTKGPLRRAYSLINSISEINIEGASPNKMLNDNK
jgi:hypothetical protein